MVARYASGFNAFVAEATGQVIAFVRDPSKYKYNQYTQLVKSPATVGLYYKLHVDDVQRLTDLNETAWEDGAKRPNPNKGDGIRFEPTEFQCVRHDFPFSIGWKALDMGQRSGLKLLIAHSTLMRNKAQMHRTQRLITLLETAGNWSGNTAAANTLNGGFGQWDLASNDPTSPFYLAIKKTLDAVAIKIHLKTNGAVGNFGDAEDSGLRLIVSPNAATKMSQTDEIRDMLKQSPFAMDQITGKKAGQNAKWGLPERIYGWDLVVEDAVRVNNNPVAAGTEATLLTQKVFIKGDDSAVVVSRPGGLDGEYGAPSFSTVQLYHLQEMDLETFDDTKHRLTEGHVSIDDKEVLAAPQSGFLITDILSV
jgi:hypothetical protein